MARTDVNIILTAKDNASKTIKGVGSSFKDASKSFLNLKNVIVGAGVAVAINRIGKEAIELARTAQKFQGVEYSFGQMTKGIIENQDEFVASVKKATGNTLSEYDVLVNANKTLALIGKDTFTDFGTQYAQMAEVARKSSVAMGTSVEYAFTSLVTGVGRESKMILDNLGITTDITGAKERYAEQLGKTAEQLTATESKTATLNHVLALLDEKYATIEPPADKFAEFETKVADLKVQIGERLLPVANRLLDWLMDTGSQAGQFAKDVKDLLMPVIEYAQDQFNILRDELESVGIEVGSVGSIATFVAKALAGGLVAITIFFIGILGSLARTIANVIAWLKKAKEEFEKLGDSILRKTFPPLNTLLTTLEKLKNIGDIKVNVIQKIKEISGDEDRRAVGGMVTGGQPYVVGERGAELFVPNTTGRIIPNDQLSKTGGGGNVSLNVTVGMYAGSAVEKRNIAEELYKQLVEVARTKNKSVAEMLGA